MCTPPSADVHKPPEGAESPLQLEDAVTDGPYPISQSPWHASLRALASEKTWLLNGGDGGGKGLLALAESVAALALEATYSGSADKGLALMEYVNDIINCEAGAAVGWSQNLSRICKSDIKVAVYSGSSPCLGFYKTCLTTSSLMPSRRGAESAGPIEKTLKSCNIGSEVIMAVQTLSVFTQTVSKARGVSLACRAAPSFNNFLEDCLHVEYQLLKYPEALRDSISKMTPGETSQEQISHTGIGRGGRKVPLDLSIRIASIIYIEDLLPDRRSVDIFTRLLPLLVRQISQYMAHYDISHCDAVYAGAVRPVLLWVSMVGYAAARFTNAQRATTLEHRVFEDCAAMVLASPLADEERYCPGEDLIMCELLPLGELRCVDDNGGNLLGQMIDAHEARQG